MDIFYVSLYHQENDGFWKEQAVENRLLQEYIAKSVVEKKRKAGLHPKMLCVRLDWKGIVYYEFLLRIQTLNSDKYFL